MTDTIVTGKSGDGIGRTCRGLQEGCVRIMRIVYLPLDSRPCSYEWPVKLAKWCGCSCTVPSAKDMDCFRIPARYDRCEAFLWENAESADAFVISAEHLCFGSLLASRDSLITEDEALTRLEAVKQLHAKHPGKPIYMYGVIMRTSLSTLCAGDLDAYHNMTEFSYYSDKPGCADKARKARERLGENIVLKYLSVRKRNHAVNMRCAQLAADGIIDSLLLLQEDSEKYGFHKAEQKALSALNSQKVFIHNGADEGGALAIMHAINRSGMEADIVFTSRCHGFRALYEDRPFDENLKDTLEYAGIVNKRGAEDVLVVHTPYRGRQREATRENEITDTSLDKRADLIADLVNRGKNVYLLDVAYANGGSGELYKRLKERKAVNKLAGYSAWNTASNALGSLVAQMLSDNSAKAVNHAFLVERICDDLIYERYVRKFAADILSPSQDIFNLSDTDTAIETVRNHFNASLAEAGLPEGVCSVRLVWPRLFEMGFDVNVQMAGNWHK